MGEEEAPKLFSNKPKRAQVKQFLEQQQKELSKPLSSSSSSSSSSMASQPPPPPPPKESFARRYKFVWPMLLAVNLAIGGYLFTRTRSKKDEADNVEGEAATVVSKAATEPSAASVEKPQPSPAIKEPVKLLEPIPETQQRELYKWMLEEKRKLKPQSPEEKKRIDDEKALLKQFIRGKSVPNI